MIKLFFISFNQTCTDLADFHLTQIHKYTWTAFRQSAHHSNPHSVFKCIANITNIFTPRGQPFINKLFYSTCFIKPPALSNVTGFHWQGSMPCHMILSYRELLSYMNVLLKTRSSYLSGKNIATWPEPSPLTP